MGVGRVIARPFIGREGAFRRTANRHDYALPPAGTTLLDAMTGAGKTVHAIGKIQDLFAGRGVTTAVHTKNDEEGVDAIELAIETAGPGLVFTNLVDFDPQYGHRNNPAGYAQPGALRRAAVAAAPTLRSRPAHHHGGSRERSDDLTRIMRASMPLFLVESVSPGRHRRPSDVRRSGADRGGDLRSRPWPTAPASFAIYSDDGQVDP
jgi:hypothetical protein